MYAILVIILPPRGDVRGNPLRLANWRHVAMVGLHVIPQCGIVEIVSHGDITSYIIII